MPDHGNCHTKPCRSLRCPAEIDRLPLEQLRRFAHHQRVLIEAFRRQHNYHLDYIHDLEQQIKTLKSKTEIGPPPCTPAAARDAIENARRKVMDLYGGNLDHPALDHLEAALCTVDYIERDRG